MKNILLILAIFTCLSISAQAQTDIRKIDFKNFTYEPYCIGEEDKPGKITVKDAEFSEEKKVDEDYTERFYFKAFEIVFGDVTGDKQDDAVILTVCNTGGTGNFTEGFVYVMKNGKPTLLERIEGGDRAHGGLRTARVEDGLLVIESNDAGEMGGACCPEFVDTTKLRWNGSNLVVVGQPTKRELYPAKRITFAKGASSHTFTVKLEANDLKRFVVGARAGQTLTISTDSKDFYVNLYNNEAEEKQTLKGITARLKKTGDQIFQVQNGKETDAEVSVTVEIK